MIWLPVVGAWADIDVYACVLAYADLLNQTGESAKTYIPNAPNYSTPKSLRIEEMENRNYALAPTDQIVILDISTPEVINHLAPTKQIVELIDHHPGFEAYWHERLGDKAVIEKIGAVATIVFERWGERQRYSKMSPEIAKLLLAAILDNTLNFNAGVTTDRDHRAAEQLAVITGTSVEEFAKWYFSAVSQTVINNLEESLLGDTKRLNLPKLNLDITCGQLTVWDARSISNQKENIERIMNSKSQKWLVNVLSISEKQNYILANDPEFARYLSGLLSLSNRNGWLISERLYLRKEILAEMLDE